MKTIDQTVGNGSNDRLVEDIHTKYEPIAKKHDYSLIFQLHTAHTNEVCSIKLDVKDNKFYRVSQYEAFYKLSQELPKLIKHDDKTIPLEIHFTPKSLIQAIYERYKSR